MDEIGGHYTSKISQSQKGEYDFTYIRYLEYSNSEGQVVEW